MSVVLLLFASFFFGGLVGLYLIDKFHLLRDTLRPMSSLREAFLPVIIGELLVFGGYAIAFSLLWEFVFLPPGAVTVVVGVGTMFLLAALLQALAWIITREIVERRVMGE